MVKSDLLDSIGCKQLCVGQVGGVEAAVRSVCKLFDSEEEAVIFVDASNAFNALIEWLLCIMLDPLAPPPLLSVLLINCCRNPTSLFGDGETILASEGGHKVILFLCHSMRCLLCL